MYALRGATIYTGQTCIHRGTVLIEGDRIKDVVREGEYSEGIPYEDVSGLILVPGFIDVQINGGGDILFNDTPSLETLVSLSKTYTSRGVTGFLPTFLSDSRSKRRAALGAVRVALQAGVPGILGIHFEGPHLNRVRKGIHSESYFCSPQDEDIEILCGLDRGCVLVTLAPEVVSVQTIRTLVAQGITVSAGHTDATYDQLRQAFDEGVLGVTHLFNGMRPMMTRDPGAVGAALDHDSVFCSLITDGYHVADSVIRLAWRCKARGKLFLVSDAMPPVGGMCQTFDLYNQVIHVQNGRCLRSDGCLAGSAVDMGTALRYCIESVGLPLDEALRMCSTYPAAFLGLDSSRGRIAPRMIADLVLLDSNLHIQATWVAGKKYNTPYPSTKVNTTVLPSFDRIY